MSASPAPGAVSPVNADADNRWQEAIAELDAAQAEMKAVQEADSAERALPHFQERVAASKERQQNAERVLVDLGAEARRNLPRSP